MVTFTAENVSSFDDAKTYTDPSCTILVETLSVSALGSGVYELTGLTYASYTIGTTYYLKVTYTPSGGAQRSQIIPFLLMPQGQASGLATDADTDPDGMRVAAPRLLLRIGRGAYREADRSNAVYAPRNRYEARFGSLSELSPRGKLLYFIIQSCAAGEPFSIAGVNLDTLPQVERGKLGQG